MGTNLYAIVIIRLGNRTTLKDGVVIARLFETIYIVPTLILLVSVVSDLYRRKVYNKLIIIFLLASIANHFLFLQGFESLKYGLLSALLAFCFMVPLFITKMLGGGDLKLLVVFGLNITLSALISTFVYSLFWGLILGLVMIIVKRQSKDFIKNTLNILSFKKPEAENLHSIPYTVALLLGWLTNLSLQGFSFI